ncbi:TetR/AcrR family transcriptional regulator [Crossiella sp. CA-258035]|uniref:TetR/AcrR family transcriptional regulator n=1 Tax=Crossiella sp. CA-258035 TaxID=2981138 RepID=UPI0024BC6584|nr:TetR/AcrR family transcriptional regulator [Crossiella sp. CA-258035]WHT20051.1 TetR/AcrR family transcriptional regulator [Crossiella sp. CA-258035]
MASECHTSEAPPVVRGQRVDDEVLLAAAKDCVLDVGVRRTTLTEVARRARVSRMTLYRRFPDVTSLVAALLTREFRGLLSAVASASANLPSARERLVAGAVAAGREVAHNPLMRTILEVDPELLLPYLVQRMGSTQRLAEQFLREQVLAGQADGSVRAGDVAAQCRLLFLMVQSVVFALRLAVAEPDEAALLAELRHGLDAVLRP